MAGLKENRLCWLNSIAPASNSLNFFMPSFTHVCHELLVLSKSLVNLRRGFHGGEDDVGTALLTVLRIIDGPADVRNLLIGCLYHLDDCVPVTVVSRTHAVQGDLEIAHVGD